MSIGIGRRETGIIVTSVVKQLDQHCSTSSTTRTDFVRSAIEEKLDRLVDHNDSAEQERDQPPTSVEEELEQAQARGWDFEILRIFNKRRRSL